MNTKDEISNQKAQKIQQLVRLCRQEIPMIQLNPIEAVILKVNKKQEKDYRL